MKQGIKKALVMLLSVAMVFTMMAMPVYADDNAAAYDNSTTISDGEYTIAADHYVFTGGTGKAKLTCTKVIVSDGKAVGEFTTNSENMTHVYLGHTTSNTDDPQYYDPSTDTMGADVYKIENKQVTIPVKLNQSVDIAGRTTAMSEPHWVQYNYTITIDETPAEEEADYTAVDAAIAAVPEDLTIYTDETAAAVTAAVEAVVRGKKASEQAEVDAMATAINNAVAALELKEEEADAVTLEVNNKFRMFKPTAAKLTTVDGKKVLELTYASESYDKAYVGTAKEAVLVADESKLAVKSGDGKYLIPVEKTDGEFYVAFHSVTNKGWYDRTFLIDTAEKVLTTDNPGNPIVPDTYGDEWDEESSVVSSFNTFGVKSSKVIIENGKANITIKAGSSRVAIAKIAFIEQTATDEEKNAIAIEGTPTGEGYDYVFDFSIPVEKLGEALNVSHYQVKEGATEWHNWSKQQTLTVNSASVVNQLISLIQVQKNDEYTERYIAAAKKCWDALSDEDKLKDDGYFSEDTGDASKDDPLNTAPDKTKEILVVSFGTSFNDSRVETIGAVEKALAEAFGDDYAVRRAFTAQIIINHVQARDGEQIDNVTQAMDKAVEAGVKEMIVQPTHLMSGAEYDELKAEIDKYTDKIKITYAKPLLDSDADKEAVAKAVVEEAVKDAGYDSLEAADAEKVAFVFMGHGTSHEANVTYTYMQQKMDELGYKNCFVGTVEGKPFETSLPEVKKALDAKGYTKVVLRPLMVVAGDHAHNDMASEEEGSWYYAFVNGGEFEVEGQDEPVDIGEGLGEGNVTCQVLGLGEIESIQQLYVAHTKAVMIVPGWHKNESGKWEYINEDGSVATGWKKVSGKWYYMDNEGVMKTGWVKVSGKWYYFNKSGVMQTGWQKISGKQYFFKSSGAMASKEWVKGYYWVNKDGSWTYKYKGSWHKSNGKWWFGDTSGWYAKGTTIIIDGKSYSFDAKGWMK